MFSLKLFTCLHIIFFVITQTQHHVCGASHFNGDKDLIIDPLELVLKSTDTEGFFYCNSGVDIKKQRNKLTVSIDHRIPTPPTFQYETKQFNDTTIQIRISPNGYVGTSRINCHWDNHITFGQLADLIIGEKPGVIELKRPCQAYDRRYIQCRLHAPIIARAFRNGFRQLFKFTESNDATLSYFHPPKLVNITDDDELIFQFEPRDREKISKKTHMFVNMTLSRFGSSAYSFTIDPVHTTHVNFQIEDISHKDLTIRIDHNRTGTISERLCSGHISQIDGQKTRKAFRDIRKTVNRTIAIDRLRPSTNYEICLHCYYKQTDQSYNEEKCLTITTKPDKYMIWILVCSGVMVVIIVILIIVFMKRHTADPIDSVTRSEDESVSPPHDPLIPQTRYHAMFPTAYQDGNNFMDQIPNDYVISPDTRDLTNQRNEH